MKRYAIIAWILVGGSARAAQEPNEPNGRFTFSIDGPCGQTIEGRPGTPYDDETGGYPYYTEWRDFPDGVRRRIARQRQGHTWDVILTSADSPTGWGVHFWQFALGIEGPIEIVDITTDGTAGCQHYYPECRLTGGGINYTALTGPTEQRPEGYGDVAAYSFVLLKIDGMASLPSEGREKVCKIRVFGKFPDVEDEVFACRVFFTIWRAPPPGLRIEPAVADGIHTEPLVTQTEGDPPLTVEDCTVYLKAVGPIDSFVRCDVTDDGVLDISDPIRILGELFVGDAAPIRCRASADCNADGMRDISDAIYGLSYLFLGSPQPPAPFPECGRPEGTTEEDCPGATTRCP